MKKHKIISLIIMIVFILSSINIVFAASTPRVTLDEYEKTITKKQAVTVKGSVNIARGQQIIVKNKKGTKVATTTVNNTGSTARFSVKIPKKYIVAGNNSFKIYSAKKKSGLFTTLVKQSLESTYTIKYNAKTTKTTTKVKKKANNITISNPINVISKGSTYKLKATATNKKKCKFKSNNNKVLKVNSKGKLTAKKGGVATITITAPSSAKYKKATKKIEIRVKGSKDEDMLYMAKKYKSSSSPYVIVTQYNYYNASYGSYGRTKVYWTKNWTVLYDSSSCGAPSKSQDFGVYKLKGKKNVDDHNKTRDADRPGPGAYKNSDPKYHEFWVTRYDSGNAIHTRLYKLHSYSELYEENGVQELTSDKKSTKFKNLSGGCTRVNDRMANWIFVNCPGDTPFYIYKY